MRLPRLKLLVATLAIQMSATAWGQSPSKIEFIPCKNGAASCPDSERDTPRHVGYRLYWVGDDKALGFIQNGPYKIDDGYVRFWEITDYKYSEDEMSKVTAYYLADCKSNKYKVIQQTEFYKITNKSEMFGEQDWFYAAPGTGGDAMVSIVCK